MKRNKFFMLGIVTVLVAVLSLTFVSNTFAKYTSTVTGQDTARVAKWDWTFEGQNLKTYVAADVDLFETIVCDLNDNGTVKTGTQDSDVKQGNDEQSIIAPGTGGFFTFNLQNLSEVNAKYTLTFAETLNSVPLQFCLTNSTTSTDWKNSIADLNISANIAMNEAVAVTVYWRWNFGEAVVDNEHSEKTVSVTVTALLEQVD